MPRLEEDEVITTVDDLDDDNEDILEGNDSFAEDSESNATEVDEDMEDAEEDELSENSEDEETSESDEPNQPSEEGQDEAVELDGVEYTRSQLEQVLAIGKQVVDYQKEHPGYDPILIHKDYTRKSQELAEVKRQTVQPSAPASQVNEPDLSEFRPEDVEYFNKIASALGFVRGEDIEKREMEKKVQTYDSIKREEINKFIDTHPEYAPSKDPGDIRWNSIRSEFDLYKLPEDPRLIGQLLERAHKAVSGMSSSFDSKKVANILAKKKAATASQSSAGGSSGGGDQTPKPTSKKNERLQKLALSGALSGYTKKEIEEMFG